jgi:hypothetical protein
MASGECSKCSAPMVAGFIPDQTYGAVLAPNWYEGEPEKKLFFGVRIAGKTSHPVTAFRCSGCGFIELYAP